MSTRYLSVLHLLKTFLNCGIVFLFTTNSSLGEGSGTWGTSSARQNWLWVPSLTNNGSGVDGYQSRGYMLLPSGTPGYNEDHRLYVYVRAGETVYFGFRRTDNSTSNVTVRWYYDPTAGSSFFPSCTTPANCSSTAKRTRVLNQSYRLDGTANQAGKPGSALAAHNGPSQLTGTGYTGRFFTNTTSIDRAYWVEMESISSTNIDFWDITVVAPGNIEKKGRVYSKYWSIANSRNTGTSTALTILAAGEADQYSFHDDFGFFVPVLNTEKGNYFVKRVRFPGASGGWTNFFANQDGPRNSGSFDQNRKSISGTSSNTQYPLFLNDPDPDIWLTTQTPTASLSIDYREKTSPLSGGEAILDITIDLPAVVDILIDLNNNGIYDEGIDIIISENYTDAGTYQIYWNGEDAAGNELDSGSDVEFIAAVIFFPVHFPIFDLEQSLGIRVTNVRPGPVEDNMIYWDDSNVPRTGVVDGIDLAYSARSIPINVTGLQSPNHIWWATDNNGFGNNYTINTWAASYYTEVKDKQGFNFLRVTGNVFDDLNGLDDHLVNGLPTTATGLNAILVNSLGEVRKIAPVMSDGTFSIAKIANGQYRIFITTTLQLEGQPSTAPVLPNHWEHTGETIGTGTGHDGLIDGYSAEFLLHNASLAQVNFGIRPILTDLSISKTVDESTPEFDTEVTFTIEAHNAGPSNAYHVNVLESMPSGYSYLNHTVTDGTFDVTEKRWEIEYLPRGATQVLTITAKVLEDGNYINDVLITSPTPDPDLSNNDDTASTEPFRILSVSWLSISGESTDNQHRIEWATSQESNSSYFLLQRSANSTDWVDIGREKAAENAQVPTFYSLIDTKPIAGNNYYRVVHRDTKGNAIFSKVIRIEFDPKWSVQISPNPFTDEVILEARNVNELSVNLLDLQGKQVPVRISTVNGSRLCLETDHLASGVYFLRVYDKKQVYIRKLIKTE